MMRRRLVVAAALLGLSATSVHAQNAIVEQCGTLEPRYEPATAGTIIAATYPATYQNIERQTRFVCGHVASAVTALQPTVGISFSGGNPVLGTATTLGTRFGLLPRVSVTARATIALAEAPDFLDYASRIESSGEQLPPIGSMMVPVGSFQGDVSVGVFNGVSLGLISGVGAVDLLGSISMVPRIEQIGMEKPILSVAGGARVGMIKQGLLMPGLSVSGMYRRMGSSSFGSIDDDDPGEFRTDLTTLSLRAIASKGLLLFDFAAGVGYDRYSGGVSFGARVLCESAECRAANAGAPVAVSARVSDAHLQTAAWNVFGNASMSLLLVRFIAEVGYQKSLDLLSVEDLRAGTGVNEAFWEEELKAGKLFGSIGIRLAI
jgi:hypothetical protein